MCSTWRGRHDRRPSSHLGQTDLPWLLGPEQPRIFGSYGSIKRDYLIDGYLADLEGTGITKSVYAQANWAPNWFEDEVA